MASGTREEGKGGRLSRPSGSIFRRLSPAQRSSNVWPTRFGRRPERGCSCAKRSPSDLVLRLAAWRACSFRPGDGREKRAHHRSDKLRDLSRGWATRRQPNDESASFPRSAQAVPCRKPSGGARGRNCYWSRNDAGVQVRTEAGGRDHRLPEDTGAPMTNRGVTMPFTNLISSI